MRSRRAYRSRCYVCRTVLSRILCTFHQWNSQSGWHMVFPLCTPCWRAISEIATTVAQEYE